MLISYEPNSDVLTIAMQAEPVTQTQIQGAATVGFDAAGNLVSALITDASTVLWEHGGQVQILLPQAPSVATTVVETTRIVERSR